MANKVPLIKSASRPDIDLSVLEAAAKQATYPSEDKKLAKLNSEAIDSGFLMVRGQKIAKKTILVRDPANDTTLWEANPRNLALKVYINDLVPSIKHNGTNSNPVVGRFVTGDDRIQILYGCRRRLSAIEAGVPLTVDLIDVEDDIAEILVDEENEGREDLDFIASCRYLYKRFGVLKAKKRINVTEFATEYAKPLLRQMKQHFKADAMTRQNMTSVFQIAEISDYLLMQVKDPTSWGMRKASSLRKICKNLAEVGVDESEITERLSKLGEDHTFDSVDSYLSWLSTLLPTGNQERSDKQSAYTIMGKKVTINRSANGSVTVKLPVGLDQLVLSRITTLLESIEDN